MIVGCYNMDLYCDGVGPHRYNQFSEQYVGNSKKEVYKEARHRGWMLLEKSQQAFCPKCSKKIEGEKNGN